MDEAIDDLNCEYYWASGATFEDCAWLTRRWRDSYGTTLSDSDFLVCATDNGDDVEYWGPWPNILPALWRALPSGRVYVPDASQGSVHVYDDVMDADPTKIRRFELGFAPEGVWGLDEQRVYVWGIRNAGPASQAPHLACFDGKSWQEVPSPGFYITKMHGLAPDLIYAAGRDAGLARWDGRAWTVFRMPTGEILSDVSWPGPTRSMRPGTAGRSSRAPEMAGASLRAASPRACRTSA